MYLSSWLNSSIACAVVTGVGISIAILVIFVLIIASFSVGFCDQRCEIDIVVLLEIIAVDLNYRVFLGGCLLLIIFSVLSIE